MRLHLADHPQAVTEVNRVRDACPENWLALASQTVGFSENPDRELKLTNFVRGS